mgnify:CR=1 FL=1
MTGLHGLHVLAGMGAIFWLLVRSIKGHFGPDYFTPVDFVGLYWHLVDLIWIFPLPAPLSGELMALACRITHGSATSFRFRVLFWRAGRRSS